MNWTHLISQVECMILDSVATPEEFKDILSTSDWYKHEAWRTEKWWFGRGTTMAEVTFEGLIAMFDWMGLDKVIVEAMRMQIASMVDELIANEEDHTEEMLEMVKEEAAA